MTEQSPSNPRETNPITEKELSPELTLFKQLTDQFAIITGSTALAVDNIPPQSQAHEFLQQAKEAAIKSARLIGDLERLSLSRSQSSENSPK